MTPLTVASPFWPAFLFFRYGAVFTVPMMGKNITFLIGPEAQAPFFKLNVSGDSWSAQRS